MKSPGCTLSSPTRAWTGPISPLPPWRPSRPTTTAKLTRSPTCVMNFAPRASIPAEAAHAAAWQIRRQAGKMRHYGPQRMVVINSGDPLPDLVIVTLARWLWRYRSDLVPLPGYRDRSIRLGVACHASAVVVGARRHGCGPVWLPKT